MSLSITAQKQFLRAAYDVTDTSLSNYKPCNVKRCLASATFVAAGRSVWARGRGARRPSRPAAGWSWAPASGEILFTSMIEGPVPGDDICTSILDEAGHTLGTESPLIPERGHTEAKRLIYVHRIGRASLQNRLYHQRLACKTNDY